MKITRRQLQRLIESTLFEQPVNKAEEMDMIAAIEVEDIEQEEASRKRDQEVVEEALANIVSLLVFMKNGKSETDRGVATDSKMLDYLNKFANAIDDSIVNRNRIDGMSGVEILDYVESRLKQLDKEYSGSSEVLYEKIGLLYMKENPGLEKVFGDPTGEQKNLGNFLVDKISYKNLKNYPTLYRIYQANV